MFFAHLLLICAKNPLWFEKKDGNLYPDLQLCLNFMKNLYICMGFCLFSSLADASPFLGSVSDR